MKQQITRLSPHQNAKVFAVLLAASSLAFVIPLTIVALAAGPSNQGPFKFFFLLMPFIYLIAGYLMTIIGCSAYNFMYKYIGGIEFIAKSDSD